MIASQSVALSVASAASVWFLTALPLDTESPQGGSPQGSEATKTPASTTQAPKEAAGVTVRVTRDSSDGAIVFEAGEHDLITMLETGARALSHRYVFATKELAPLDSRAIDLAQPLRIPRNRIQSTLFRLAAGRGLAPIPVDPELKLYEWIYSNGPRRHELAQRALSLKHTALDPLDHAGVFVRVRIPLEHLQANMIQNSLRPYYMSSGTQGVIMIGSLGEALIVSGPGDLVHGIVQFVLDEDRRGEPRAKQLELWQAQIAKRLGQLELDARTRPPGSRR